MQVEPGFSILLPKKLHEKAHLWVVLTWPTGPEREVVMVNLTTRRGVSDTTVVLDRGDHPFISHATVVNYSDARLVPAEKVTKAVELFERQEDFEAEVLERIQQGIYASDRTPNRIKEYCRDHF